MLREEQIWVNCAVTAALELPQGQVDPEVRGKNIEEYQIRSAQTKSVVILIQTDTGIKEIFPCSRYHILQTLKRDI